MINAMFNFCLSLTGKMEEVAIKEGYVETTSKFGEESIEITLKGTIALCVLQIDDDDEYSQECIVYYQLCESYPPEMIKEVSIKLNRNRFTIIKEDAIPEPEVVITQKGKELKRYLTPFVKFEWYKNWKDGLSWKDINAELDGIDDRIDRDNKQWKDPKFRNQPMQGQDKGKLRHEVDPEWKECSKHEIKYRGIYGGCSICMLRVLFEEKQRLGAQS